MTIKNDFSSLYHPLLCEKKKKEEAFDRHVWSFHVDQLLAIKKIFLLVIYSNQTISKLLMMVVGLANIDHNN